MANVLRENGVLGTIKAQLRSNVYLALNDGKELRVSGNDRLEITLLCMSFFFLSSLKHIRNMVYIYSIYHRLQ